MPTPCWPRPRSGSSRFQRTTGSTWHAEQLTNTSPENQKRTDLSSTSIVSCCEKSRLFCKHRKNCCINKEARFLRDYLNSLFSYLFKWTLKFLVKCVVFFPTFLQIWVWELEFFWNVSLWWFCNIMQIHYTRVKLLWRGKPVQKAINKTWL